MASTDITATSVAALAGDLAPGVLEAAFKKLDPGALKALNSALVKAKAQDQSKAASLRATKYATKQDFNTLKKVVNVLREKVDLVFENVGKNKKAMNKLQSMVARGSSVRMSSSESFGASQSTPGDISAGLANSSDPKGVMTPKSAARSKMAQSMASRRDAGGVKTAGKDRATAKRKIYYRFGSRRIPVVKPTNEIGPKEKAAKPAKELALDYAYGYQGNDAHSRQNLLLSHDKRKLIYYIAGVCVVHDLDKGTQRFFTEHNEDVTCVAIHPTKKLVASGQVDPKGPEMPCIALWNYEEPEESLQIIEDAHDWEVLKVQFSPNNNYLYSIGGDDDHTLKIWDLETVLGKQTNDRKIEPVANLAPTSKEELFGICVNPFVDESDTKGGQLLDEFVSFGRRSAKFWWIRSNGKDDKGKPKFNIRGRQVVLGEFAPQSAKPKNSKKSRNRGPAKKKKTVFSTTGGQEACFHVIEFHSKDTGVYFMGGHSGALYVAKQSSVVGKVDAHLGEPVGDLEVLDNGDLLSLGLQGTVKRWKLNGKRLDEMMVFKASIPGLHAHVKPVKLQARATAMDVPAGILYVGTKDNRICKLQLDNAKGDEISCPSVVNGHEGAIWGLSCHPSANVFITGGHDRMLMMWDSESNELLDFYVFDDKESKIECCTFSGDGKLLAVGLSNSKIALFTYEPSFELSDTIELPKKKKNSTVQEVIALRFSPDDTMLGACHDDLCAHVLDVVLKPKPTLRLWRGNHMDHTASPTHIRWSKNGDHICTFTRDYEMMFWTVNKENKKCVHEIYSEDPDKVTFVGDPLIAGYDVMGCYQVSQGWDGTDLNYVARSHDEKLVAAGDDFGTVRIHNYPALQEDAHYAYTGHSAFVVGLGFVHDDKALITVGGGDRAIFKWKVEDV